MTRLSATTESTAVITADRSSVWQVLTDPACLTQLTPLLQRIRADGSLWHWEMAQIPLLGLKIAPSFTERMTFDPEREIGFTHAPPEGTTERAAAEGVYRLADDERGTCLRIRLRLDVDVPLPRPAHGAAEKVMARVVRSMGDRFSANLLAHLGATQVA